MNTSKQKKYRLLTLALVFVGGVFCICQDANAVKLKWYNKDIYNMSGQEGNDIHFHFGQVTLNDLQAAVVAVYNHPGFTGPTYDSVVDTVRVKWEGPVPNDPLATNKIHLGILVDLDKLPQPYLPSFANVVLTKDGQYIGKAAGCAKPEVVFVSENIVGIDITAPFDDPSITVDEVHYSFVADPIPLEMLNGDNADIIWISIPDPPAEGFDFSPDQTIRVANVEVSPGSHIVVSARVRFTGDSELGAGHVFFQSEVPPPPTREPPTVSQWGLIVMALLLVTVGAIMIRKRRQITA